MNRADIPTNVPVVWGRDAGGAYIRPIPLVSQIGINDGFASMPTGFVPLNMTPVEAGGVPPFGPDMNGVLKLLSAWSQWLNAGGPVPFDATFAAGIGGYPAGAILSSTVLGKTWLNLTDGNAGDPDTGAPNWYSPQLGGHQLFTASGNFTVPAYVTSLRRVRGVGGGGGASTGVSGGTGASAGSFELLNVPVTPGAVIAVTVGGPGANAVSPAFGADGGATTFQGATSPGGGGSHAGSGVPSTSTGGDFNGTGNPGWDFQGSGFVDGPGGASMLMGYGRGAGANAFAAYISTGGAVMIEY